MLCKFCNEEIPKESAFCPKCGKEVQTMVVVPESSETISTVTEQTNIPTPPPQRKKKGLVPPIIILLISVSGWLYILSSNSIKGMMAWFTSSDELKTNISQQYNYYGNNFSIEEFAGNVILLVIMVLLSLLGIIGLVMLIRRLIRKFVPTKRG